MPQAIRGRGPIVMRLENGYRFYEHSTIASAKAEAHRLAAEVGGRFVVMVPVALIETAPKTVETTIHQGYQIVETFEPRVPPEIADALDDNIPF